MRLALVVICAPANNYFSAERKAAIQLHDLWFTEGSLPSLRALSDHTIPNSQAEVHEWRVGLKSYYSGQFAQHHT